MGRALGYSRLFMGRDLLPENRKEYAHAIAIYTTHTYTTPKTTLQRHYAYTHIAALLY